MNPQISFFINFFIKNGSHGTIYAFKNYFATVILAISFQFQQNKSYPNRPYTLLLPNAIFLRQAFTDLGYKLVVAVSRQVMYLEAGYWAYRLIRL